MKLATCFIVCAILILQYNSADAGLGDFFRDVHKSVDDTIHKVRADIRNVLVPKKSETESEAKPIPETPTDEKKTDTEKDSDFKPVETTTQSTTTTTAGAVKTETTTKQDGRENFSGACLPGYFRTADGRCKPSF